MTAPEPLSEEASGATAAVEALARLASAGDSTPVARQPAPAADDLRPAVAAVLARLASRAEPELAATLARARTAWDQADSFSVLDLRLQLDIAALQRRLEAAAAPDATAARRAIALEGLLALDVAVALVRLFERRLAALLRLRLRSATPELLPAGRPFLDLGRALHEAAEAWR